MDFDEPAHVDATSETTLRFFQRAALPGPNGAIVETDPQLPAYEYVSVTARGIDAFGETDGLSMEFWGWSSLNLVRNDSTGAFDGDIGSIHATQRFGSTWVRIGRQLVTGDAARYARFDGLNVGARLGDFRSHHFGLEGYGGFSVLPRWNSRPGYHHLGSAQDSLVDDPQAFEDVSRSGYLLAGTKAFYGYGRVVDASISFHDQTREGELDRRNVGASLNVFPLDAASVHGAVTMDVDSVGVADARTWLELDPHERIGGTVEFHHAQPDLLLSRQSVLSVFTTDAFDEAGAEFTARVTESLDVAPFGYVQWFPEQRTGARGGLRVSTELDRKRTRVSWSYSRVLVDDTGYHSLRTALHRSLTATVTLFGDAYYYAYDQPIEGHSGSSVYAGSCGWDVGRGFDLLLGGSLASTPYAEADLQSTLRLRFREIIGLERSRGER